MNVVNCQVCAAEGAETASDVLLKPLSDACGMPEGMTAWLCKQCLTRVVLSWYAEPEPGVLEQIEADEGKVTPAGRNGRGRKSVPTEDAGTVEGQAQAETADVNE